MTSCYKWNLLASKCGIKAAAIGNSWYLRVTCWYKSMSFISRTTHCNVTNNNKLLQSASKCYKFHHIASSGSILLQNRLVSNGFKGTQPCNNLLQTCITTTRPHALRREVLRCRGPLSPCIALLRQTLRTRDGSSPCVSRCVLCVLYAMMAFHAPVSRQRSFSTLSCSIAGAYAWTAELR